MREVLGLDSLGEGPRRSVVCIGKFFAVHRGHQALLRATVAEARRRDAEAVVLTFDRHPRELLQPGYAPPVLSSLEERLALIAAGGPDLTVVLSVTPDLLAMDADAFVRELLVQRLGAIGVLAGEQFHFGKGAQGDVALLRRLGSELGFTYTPLPAVLADGERVSSSRVAACIAAGDVTQTAELLGRPYAVPGTVVHGRQLGRQLGFPTANIAVPAGRLLPLDGVYVARLETVAGDLPAVANLGVRPTVDGRRHMVEAHALDWSGELYGQEVRLAFLQRLRGEHRFDGLDELKAQITRDAEAAAGWFAGTPIPKAAP